MRGVLFVQVTLACNVALLGGCGATAASGSGGATGSGAASTAGAIGGSGGTGTSANVGGTGMGGDLPTGGNASGEGGAGGTGGGEASCDSVLPCGGDVVGTWTVSSSCLTLSGEMDLTYAGLPCLSAPITGSLQVTGTWTATADGTVSDNTTTSGSVQIDLPESCKHGGGTIVYCERLSDPIQSAGYASVDCLDSASGGCTCEAIVNQASGLGLVTWNPSATGSYAAVGTELAVTPDDLHYAYCVSESTLAVNPQSESPKVTTGAVLFQRQ